MSDTTVSTEIVAAALPIPAVPVTSAALSRSKARKEKPDTENEAIIHCMKAWNYAYKKKAADLDEGQSDYPAEKVANQAYLRETPPLSGHKNICDFIACINFASMTDIINHREATLYMANARIALAALSLQPKPQATGAKSGGKPAPPLAEEAGE